VGTHVILDQGGVHKGSLHESSVDVWCRDSNESATPRGVVRIGNGSAGEHGVAESKSDAVGDGVKADSSPHCVGSHLNLNAANPRIHSTALISNEPVCVLCSGHSVSRGHRCICPHLGDIEACVQVLGGQLVLED